MEAIDEVLDYMKKNPTYHLATVDENGNPHVRPFGTVAKFEGKLYIQTGKVKDVFKQLAAHPKIAISDMGSDGTWLRIEADATEDDRRKARVAVLADYPELHELYDPDDGNCAAILLENVRATFCSFTSEPRTVTF